MAITIHVIFNAHLDPVWMWPWTSGLDEAIATARSACDRLDAHPDLFYTQGEVWPLEMVERADPALFERIRRHIASGRWELVNGWWVQPDCNFPTAEGLARQITTGCDWLQARFGVRPRCGFNPDSFGHCAALPEILRAHGQDRYVFMRPGEGEMKLPWHLFDWRGRAGGPAVRTFRIAGSYANGLTDVWLDPVVKSVEKLPTGVHHTMTFMGVGNHGGGPTEFLIRWVREHRDLVPGARLEFSTIGRFFDAVEREGAAMPEQVGELQQHAVGCYAIHRAVKTGIRRAEHALVRAESAGALHGERLAEAWRQTCAHQFHDTCGGTCVPEAERQVVDQLGGAAAVAEEALAYDLRRRLAVLPADPLPRIVLGNPGPGDFDGWCEAGTYVEGPWAGDWRLLDRAGAEVPFQRIASGTGTGDGWVWGMRRILLHRRIATGGVDELRCDISAKPAPLPARVSAGDGMLTGEGIALITGAAGAVLRAPGRADLPMRLALIADATDTWSHGLDRYAEAELESARWGSAAIIDRGPLMASLVQEGTIGDSRLSAEWRVHAGEAAAELRLDVHWRERHRLLKLVLPLAGEAEREDGTPGLALARPNDGRELPLHDWTRIGGLGVVCPDAYALDATPQRLRLTLLRAPLMAHHDPAPAGFPRAVAIDQGVHRFRFRFHLAPRTAEALRAAALAMHRPPLVADLTRGMQARFTEYRADGSVR